MGILSSGLLNSKETITARADIWCPYNCEANANAPGILIELMQMTYEKEGYKIDYSTMPWPQAVADVRSGRFNSAVGVAGPVSVGMSHSENPQIVSITCAYALNSSNKKITKANDLHGLNSIGTVKDYSYGEQTDKVIAEMTIKKKVFPIGLDDALKINIRRMLDGKIESLIEDVNVMDYMLKNLKISKIKKIGCTEDKSLIWIGFTESNPNARSWVEMLVKKEAELVKSGEMNKLYQKYGATK